MTALPFIVAFVIGVLILLSVIAILMCEDYVAHFLAALAAFIGGGTLIWIGLNQLSMTP